MPRGSSAGHSVSTAATDTEAECDGSARRCSLTLLLCCAPLTSDDPTVQRDMKTWPFKVVNEGGKPIIEVDYRNETKRFKPEEISSMVSSARARRTRCPFACATSVMNRN
jgi:hypothetical protein